MTRFENDNIAEQLAQADAGSWHALSSPERERYRVMAASIREWLDANDSDFHEGCISAEDAIDDGDLDEARDEGWNLALDRVVAGIQAAKASDLDKRSAADVLDWLIAKIPELTK